MPGPPPKDITQRRRRNAPLANTLHLPAQGRAGDPPPWPLNDPSEDELTIWIALWTTPQAVAWERLGWTRTVARYARFLLASEEPSARPSLLNETRQMEDRLGLTPMAMLRLRWDVDSATPAPVTPIPAQSDRRLILSEEGDED
jgi:hypothetical protein